MPSSPSHLHTKVFSSVSRILPSILPTQSVSFPVKPADGGVYEKISLIGCRTGDDHHSKIQRIHPIGGYALCAVFLTNAKFPKPTYKHILSVLEGLLDQLKERLDDLSWFALGEQIHGEKSFHDRGFGETHRSLLNNESARAL